MKTYNTVLITLLATMLLIAGCTDESLKEGGKVPLHISAVIPAVADSVVTRAEAINSFKVALSTISGSYASAAKTYTVALSGGSYAFSPASEGDALAIAILQTSTPLTIYGEMNNVPYFYSNGNTTANRGVVADVKLTYAYAKVAVRILKAGKTETAGTYIINSSVLKQPGKEVGGGYQWNTEGAIPKLTEGTEDVLQIQNTDQADASSLDFTNGTEICMTVTPTTVAGNTSQLFALTETAASKTYHVSAPADGFTFEAGKAYLLTVDLDKEAIISQIDITSMNQEELDFRSRPGIYTLQDLKNFRDAWNTNGEAGFENDAYIKWKDEYSNTITLLTDIDMESENWTPIKNFSGTFEGNGHTISNLSAINTEPGAYSGFFESVVASKSGTSCIQNLNIKDVQVSGYMCGALSGSVNDTNIINCSVLGNMTIGGSMCMGVGGFVGLTYNALFERCTISGLGEGSKITNQSAVGGFCGSTGSAYIVACNINNVSISADSPDMQGIFVGHGGGSVSIYGCIGYNITSFTGSFGGDARTTGCYFYNISGLDSGTNGYTSSMESLNTYTAQLNVGLYEFNQLDKDDITYVYKGSSTPALTGPVLVSGNPTTLPDDANFETREVGIYTAHELVAFAAATTANDATELAKYQKEAMVKVMKDIDIDGIAYTPCDISNITFQGNNGQRTISNLSGATGLFNTASGTITIKDLIMKDVDLSGDNCAAFIITNNANLTIEYCKVTGGKMVGTNIVAGILASAPGSGTHQIHACTIDNVTFKGTNRVGGIFGEPNDSFYGTRNIYGCAVVNSDLSSSLSCGGIQARSFRNRTNINSCILYNLNISAPREKAIFIGYHLGFYDGGTGGVRSGSYISYCYWDLITGTSTAVYLTGSSNCGYSDYGNKTPLNNDEVLGLLNTNIGLSDYQWVRVEGQDYPAIVKQTN